MECDSCAAPFPVARTGRPRRFCSAACRARAWRERRSGRPALIPSGRVATSAATFADILHLHVPPGSTVADPTYGRGVFWRLVPGGRYRVLASDLRDGVDLRALPYPDASVDAIVLDPPFREGFLRAKPETRSSFHADAYSAGTGSTEEAPKWHEAVLALYADGLREARRVLRPGGVAIVKCQDAVSANRLRLTHVDVLAEAERLGFRPRDLFVSVRAGRPPASPNQRRQLHSRRNFSVWLVLERNGRFVRPRRSAS